MFRRPLSVEAVFRESHRRVRNGSAVTRPVASGPSDYQGNRRDIMRMKPRPDASLSGSLAFSTFWKPACGLIVAVPVG